MAFAPLLIVALLGFSMLAIWSRQRSREPAAAATTGEVPPERHFPVAIAGAHGVLAATTLVLVLLVALDVGS